jgi:hypothetical protein
MIKATLIEVRELRKDIDKKKDRELDRSRNTWIIILLFLMNKIKRDNILVFHNHPVFYLIVYVS